MGKRATLALLVVALGLTAYIVAFERDSLSSTELESRKGRVLSTFVRERVHTLEIQRKGDTLRLERPEGEEQGWEPWRVVSPWDQEADDDAVDGVLGELEWLDARRELRDVSAEDLSQFGLDKPRLRLWYEAGRTRTLLEIGHQDVHGDGVYVRVDGEPRVYVVPATLEEALNHELSHFRTKQFLGTITIAWARSIEIRDGDDAVSLELRDDSWWVQGEPRVLGDTRTIDEWLRRFDDLRASRYAPAAEQDALRGQLADTGRSARVRILPDTHREDKSPKTLDLRVGGPCGEHEGERYATVGERSPVVCLREAQVAPLFEELDRLRLRRLFDFDVSEIESIRWESRDRELSLARDAEKWVEQGAEDGATQPRKAVEAWLSDLSERKSVGVQPRSPGPAVSTLELGLAGGRTWRLEVSAPSLDGAYVRRQDEPAELRYDRTTIDQLTLWEGRLRPLRLWEHRPSQVKGARIEGPEGTVRTLVLGEHGWAEAGASEASADSQRVREIVRDAIKLEAERWRAGRSRPLHGLATPQLRVTFQLEQGGEANLRVGAETGEGGHFVQVDGGPVAELSRQSVAMLRELLAPVAAE